jgi:thiamine-phosphate pyrophosphorylase
MTIPSQFGFYSVLTDPIKGYEFLTKLLVDYKIAFVQLRIKDGDESEILKTAEKMRAITHNTSTKLIINDFPEIAIKVTADGTHIGQSDRPIEEVRTQVGDTAIIGLSTHSPFQTINANSRKPDYIGIGPVHATPTKKNPDPVIGISGMKEMLALATVPAVVIGGIDFTNIRNILDAGAKNFCMVRQLTHSESPEKVLKEMMKIYNEYYPGFY